MTSDEIKALIEQQIRTHTRQVKAVRAANPEMDDKMRDRIRDRLCRSNELYNLLNLIRHLELSQKARETLAWKL